MRALLSPKYIQTLIRKSQSTHEHPRDKAISKRNDLKQGKSNKLRNTIKTKGTDAFTIPTENNFNAKAPHLAKKVWLSLISIINTSVTFMKALKIQMKLFPSQEKDLTEGYNFSPHIFHAQLLFE